MITRDNDRLAILGLGLMGGSLGLAVRASGLPLHVAAYARREQSRREALARGVADSVHATAGEAVEGAGLVVLCTPVLEMDRLLAGCRRQLGVGAVVTDVGSTKASLIQRLTPLATASGAAFVGSHPVCGSERTGMVAARADLYRGAHVIVTEEPGIDQDALARVEALWGGVGARVTRMTAEAHDRMFAWTSHLPHLAAAALVAATAGATRGSDVFAGTGFRDTTRIAQGSASVWHDIVKTNATHLDAALSGYMDALQWLHTLIRTGRFEDVRQFLAEAAEARARLIPPE